jgi:hypothetical protein
MVEVSELTYALSLLGAYTFGFVLALLVTKKRK